VKGRNDSWRSGGLLVRYGCHVDRCVQGGGGGLDYKVGVQTSFMSIHVFICHC
jgi:hypothetical protein